MLCIQTSWWLVTRLSAGGGTGCEVRLGSEGPAAACGHPAPGWESCSEGTIWASVGFGQDLDDASFAFPRIINKKLGASKRTPSSLR